MSIMSRLASIGLSLGLMVLIIELIRRRKLKEKYALLWLFTGSIILILAICDRLLGWIIAVLGIKLPINAAFFFGIFFIILMNLHFSLVISNLSEQSKILAQKIALLEFEIESKNRSKSEEK